MDTTVKLTTKEYDQHITGGTPSNDEILIDQGMYQRIIGKLLYLTVTRPDIAYSVETLSQFLLQSHMNAALRIIRYIKGKPSQGLLMSSSKKDTLTTHCDADWAACALSRKSITGFIIKLGDSFVSWKSKKQSTGSRSSAESEYRSLVSTIAELTWLNGLIKDLGVQLQLPVTILSDSKATLQITANPVYMRQQNTSR
ncbi:uncharacterized mitochondrial protein AtMg00810-like [Capsicum annuum]|uniref:uncharacterized mitochondrial protein AtMg00810-like n=1 Tax=Capsicum annuum TaxID=4072 RepID=UPI0007BFA8B1|nr:uncharacterized mitochondrial protein AtMg00810-like [Capsicum annuum]